MSTVRISRPSPWRSLTRTPVPESACARAVAILDVVRRDLFQLGQHRISLNRSCQATCSKDCQRSQPQRSGSRRKKERFVGPFIGVQSISSSHVIGCMAKSGSNSLSPPPMRANWEEQILLTKHERRRATRLLFSLHIACKRLVPPTSRYILNPSSLRFTRQQTGLEPRDPES